jgi:hypothetical protein
MEWNELPLEPRNMGVPSGAFKIIFEPMIRLAQTVHLSWVNMSTISKWIKLSFHLSLITQEYHRVRPKRLLNLGTSGTNRAPVLNQDLHYLQMDRNELPLEPRHLWVPSGASKMISDPMVHMTQTMHLSCTDANSVSKWTITGFHMTHIT